MSAFATHLNFEFRSGLRSSTQMLMNYLFPLGFYLMMGLVMIPINPMFTDTMIPALVLVTIMAGCVLGLPAPIIESREKGIFRSYKINGIPATSILLMPALSTALHTLIASTLIAISAGPVFGAAMPENGVMFGLLVLLSVVALSALGMLIGVISSSARAMMLWTQIIFLPSMLLGGLMMPLNVLPESVQGFAALLPSTHAMQAIEGLAYGRETVYDPLISVLVLVSSAVVSCLLAIYLFSWDNAENTRRGHPLLAVLALAPYVAAMLLA